MNMAEAIQLLGQFKEMAQPQDSGGGGLLNTAANMYAQSHNPNLDIANAREERLARASEANLGRQNKLLDLQISKAGIFGGKEMDFDAAHDEWMSKVMGLAASSAPINPQTNQPMVTLEDIKAAAAIIGPAKDYVEMRMNFPAKPKALSTEPAAGVIPNYRPTGEVYGPPSPPPAFERLGAGIHSVNQALNNWVVPQAMSRFEEHPLQSIKGAWRDFMRGARRR